MNDEMISFWHSIEENIVRIVFISSWEKTIVADINLDLDSLSLQVEDKTKNIVSDLMAKEIMGGYRKMKTKGCDLSIIKRTKGIVDKYILDNHENCKMEELTRQMESVLLKNCRDGK